MALALNDQTLAASYRTMSGPRGDALRRWLRLYADFSSWRSQYIELSDNIQPRRGRFLLEESMNNRGRRRAGKIVDSTPTYAARTMAAGMLSGMTSPARPWFRFTTTDPEMMKYGPVQRWLASYENLVRAVLHMSNFYTLAPTLYSELGIYGTAALYRERDPKTVVRFRQFTAGEYVIAEGGDGRVDTLGRKFTYTVGQIVEKFLANPQTKEINWGGASHWVKQLWDQSEYDVAIPIIHMIQPRRVRDISKQDVNPKHKRFSSVYTEEGGNAEDVLREAGYNRFPAYVPRWDVVSGDVYGRSPGMDALADIKQLHHEQKRKGQAIDKHVSPPYRAPASMKGRVASQLPSSVTYINPDSGGGIFEPSYVIKPEIGALAEDIREIQLRVQHGFYADLFAMMLNSDRRQITATEVAERHEEKLILLGPVLQQLNTELLDPMLDDIADFILELGILPPPPPELEGEELETEYISLLHQAQKAVAASSIERTLGFAGNLVAVFPEIRHVIDGPQAVRKYGHILGADPEIIRDAEETMARIRQEEERLSASQGVQDAGQAAQAAKVLSEADTQNPNALTALIGGGTQ